LVSAFRLCMRIHYPRGSNLVPAAGWFGVHHYSSVGPGFLSSIPSSLVRFPPSWSTLLACCDAASGPRSTVAPSADRFPASNRPSSSSTSCSHSTLPRPVDPAVGMAVNRRRPIHNPPHCQSCNGLKTSNISLVLPSHKRSFPLVHSSLGAADLTDVPVR
jgi:hypothetical protein